MNTKLKTTFIIVAIIGMVGLINDATNGFYILRNSNSMVGAALGIISFGTIYLVGEICVDFINSKDKASNSIIKRAFSLLIILLFVGAVVTLSFYFFQKL